MKTLANTQGLHLIYALGFLMGRSLKNVPQHFLKVEFPLPLFIHPYTNISVASYLNQHIAIIGEVAHPEHPELNQVDIANLLCRAGTEQQKEIDKLIGRFAIAYGSTGCDFKIQTDAIGMRAVFYSIAQDEIVIGSHAKLVFENSINSNETPDSNAFKWGYPGIGTPYPSTWRLPPNVDLSFSSGKLTRFFPLEAIPECTISQAWDAAFTGARLAITAFKRRKPIVVSLTAGLDSRTTLAALRGHLSDLTFFTYRTAPVHIADVDVSADIAQLLGLKHDIVTLAQGQKQLHLLDQIRANTFSTHALKLSCAYHSVYGDHKYLHVRTNLLELGRSNLYKKFDSWPALKGGPISANQMARFYISAAGGLPDTEYVLPNFSHYIQAAHYEDTIGLASAWDLYFIEHRMGAWHSGIVLESDIAFDTIILFNSRNIVKTIMGVPEEVRASSCVLQEKITNELPELDSIPINPKNYTRKYFSGKMDEQ